MRIVVRDHGPGLPEGAGENVFERFWRAEGGRERGKAGAGLGLAIVAAIVDAHGGASARNASGGGASSSSSCRRHGRRAARASGAACAAPSACGRASSASAPCG